MKKLVYLMWIFLGSTLIYSCKEDDSLPISQDQLLRANEWQLKETRKISKNKTIIDKLVECERRSTLDFRDIEKYTENQYKTIENNCQLTSTEGTYIYETAPSKRTLSLKKTTGETKQYYMYQLDPYYLILQEDITENDTVKQFLSVYQPKK